MIQYIALGIVALALGCRRIPEPISSNTNSNSDLAPSTPTPSIQTTNPLEEINSAASTVSIGSNAQANLQLHILGNYHTPSNLSSNTSLARASVARYQVEVARSLNQESRSQSNGYRHIFYENLTEDLAPETTHWNTARQVRDILGAELLSQNPLPSNYFTHSTLGAQRIDILNHPGGGTRAFALIKNLAIYEQAGLDGLEQGGIFLHLTVTHEMKEFFDNMYRTRNANEVHRQREEYFGVVLANYLNTHPETRFADLVFGNLHIPSLPSNIQSGLRRTESDFHMPVNHTLLGSLTFTRHCYLVPESFPYSAEMNEICRSIR